jgi:hypothetical protein
LDRRGYLWSAYCADHLFVLGAELGSQSPDVDIDGAGAAEEVMAHISSSLCSPWWE